LFSQLRNEAELAASFKALEGYVNRFFYMSNNDEDVSHPR
jgi:hypothetical protein